MLDKIEREIFSGEWILLYNNKMIDHSGNIEDMLILAKEKFPNHKYPHNAVRITKVFQGSPREKIVSEK